MARRPLLRASCNAWLGRLVCLGLTMHCPLVAAASLEFAGRSWNIKQASAPIGPGPNRFSDRPEDIWTDQEGLHLSIQQTGPFWYSTEVNLHESLGYGTYAFQTSSRLDLLNANAVFAAFTWDPFGGSPIPGDPNREIDFEDSRFGDPSDPTNSQLVVQPASVPGNRQRLTLPDLSTDVALTRFFTWSPGKVVFTTLRGHHALPHFSPADVFDQTIYLDNGAEHLVPIPDRENFRFNLWLFGSSAPVDNQSVEVLVNDFQYLPLPPANNTPLFDFESGNQGWQSFGAITTASGELPAGGASGQGRFHTADFSEPDAGNFGIVDVSPPGQDLSRFVGLSVDAYLRSVAGQPAFVGVKSLDIIVETSEAEEFFAPQVVMTDVFQTLPVAFATFRSALTSLPPTPTQLHDVTIKLVVLNTNGTGIAEFGYDEITGLMSIDNADFDADFDRDGNDFLVWQRGVGAGRWHSQGDANGNRSVDGDDLLLWKSQIGKGVLLPMSELATVPEAATNSLLLLGFIGVVAVWRKEVHGEPVPR